MRNDYPTLCLLISLVAVPSLSPGAKLYRWVDSEGNVHFSDSVPPEHVKQERTELDKRGLEVGTIGAAKTPEEIAQEAELERLRREKQRLIDEREAADRVLERTFRSVDDMVLARDGKIASIDLLIKLSESNIRQHKKKLNQLQTQAAELERAGKPVPHKLQQNISNTRNTLKDSYAGILRHEEHKKEIWTKYNTDIERFRTIKHISAERRIEGDTQVAVELPNVYRCSDQTSCDQAWRRAESFPEEFATTPIEYVSDQLIMTAPPVRNEDINITVARIRDKEDTGAQLFLDIQCLGTQSGQEFCAGPRVQLTKKRFRTYMTFGIK